MAADNPSFDTSSTLLPPRLVRMDQSTDDDLECSLHYLPKPLMREFGHVFNEEYLQSTAADLSTTSSGENLRLLAIPTNQRAREDLVAVGDHIEQEKDRLLNVVSIIFARTIFILFNWSCTKYLFTHATHHIMCHASSFPLASTSASKFDSRDTGQIISIHVQDYQWSHSTATKCIPKWMGWNACWTTNRTTPGSAKCWRIQNGEVLCTPRQYLHMLPSMLWKA